SFMEGLRSCSEVYHTLKRLLEQKKLSPALGEEGGSAPELGSGEAAIGLILEAGTLAGCRDGTDFMSSLDAAASEWKNTDLGPGFYTLPKAVKTFEREQLLEYWVKLGPLIPFIPWKIPWTRKTGKDGGSLRRKSAAGCGW